MSKSGKRESIIKYKLLYTAIILLVYMLGRSLPIYGIDMAAYTGKAMDAGELLEQTISGDRHSLFALGISPYMIASILVQMVTALRRAGSKEKISPLRTNRVMLALTFTFAVFQAATQVQELPFRPMWLPIELVKLVAAAELVAGVAMILWLSARNKKYGIGGQTALIYINIMDGILTNLTRHELRELAAPLCVAVAALIIMNVMESGEKRIPVQRISIHNIYSDKNYLAIKLNPVGVMPVMFATAFLMLPRFLLTGLGYLFPESAGILWWQENLEMDRPLGVAAYLLTLYLLTMVFALIFINPGEMAEQLLKSGDSLLERTLAMFPASVMMLTGIWYNLKEEFVAVKGYDAYRPFI